MPNPPQAHGSPGDSLCPALCPRSQRPCRQATVQAICVPTVSLHALCSAGNKSPAIVRMCGASHSNWPAGRTFPTTGRRQIRKSPAPGPRRGDLPLLAAETHFTAARARKP
jgi:hypothetical protein